MSAWFLLVPVGVLAGFLAFVWQRLAVAPGWRPRWVRYAVAVALAVLTALALAGFDVWGGWFTPAQLRPAVWVGQAFLATCLYLFLGLVPVWLVCVGIWLVRWQHDHGRVGRRRLNRVASPLVAALAVGITAYGAVEAARPSVTRFEVASPQLPQQFDGLRVALITDLHAGAVRSASFTGKVVDLANAARPDLVVIAGDTVDGTAARYSPEIAPLADLEAPLGVYAVTGNHELFRDTANWVAAFEDVGLTVLRNSSVPLQRDGAVITLAGLNDLTGDGEWASDPDAALAGTDAGVVHAVRRPPAAAGARPRGAWRRRAALGAHARRADVADQLPGAAAAADARGHGGPRGHHRGHLARRGRVGPADPGRRTPGGADHHPEAVVSDPGVVVGDDGLARPVWASVDPLLRDYYDTEWGMPVRDERGLFERLSLEAFQSGLSWATILRKRPAFRLAFAGFDPELVAAYGEADVERLMADAGIVRNRAKVLATITNARATLALRTDPEGDLAAFVWSFQPADTPRPHTYADVPTSSPESLALSKALKRKGFVFVGPTTMYALMEAVGIVDTHLLGSHRRGSSGVWPR